MTKRTGIFVFLGFSVLTLLTLAPLSDKACAGNATIATQTCDTGVWTAMAARARMETEREVMQNQNLIFKPDSILSYVCFDAFAGHAAQTVGPLFTHTGYFGASPIPQGPNGMQGAMDRVVVASMNTYEANNFNHSLLGGRGQELGLSGTRPPVQNSITGYNCNVMAEVWRTAKCMNFMHTPAFANTDGFYPFIDMQGIASNPVAGYQSIGNVRVYPANMACASGAGNSPVPGTWLDYYRYSRNEPSAFGASLYNFQANVNATYAAVRTLVAPGACQGAVPIPTGVRVMLSPSTGAAGIYLDGICTNPGCSYVRGGANAMGTCTATPTPPAANP